MRNNLFIPVISLLIISCSGDKTGEEQTEDIKDAFILTKQEVSKTMELPAELLPYEKAELYAKVDGYVEKVLTDIGDQVKQGDVLVVLEAPEMAARYAQANAEFQEAEAKLNASTDKYNRIRKASQQKGVIADAEVINSRNQMLADSAVLASTQSAARVYKQLESYLLIQAPFNGIVTNRFVDPGDLVGASGQKKLLTVERPDKFRIRIYIPESFVNSIPAKDLLSFRTDALPGKSFKATLTRKSGSIDRDTRTELWEYEYSNEDGILKPGMYTVADLELRRPDASFLVSYPAVVTTLEKKFVIRVRSEKVEWIDVREGIDTGNGIEIFGNLNEGDTLLTRGSEELKEGTILKTKIVEE